MSILAFVERKVNGVAVTRRNSPIRGGHEAENITHHGVAEQERQIPARISAGYLLRNGVAERIEADAVLCTKGIDIGFSERRLCCFADNVVQGHTRFVT